MDDTTEAPVEAPDAPDDGNGPDDGDMGDMDMGDMDMGDMDMGGGDDEDGEDKYYDEGGDDEDDEDGPEDDPMGGGDEDPTEAPIEDLGDFNFGMDDPTEAPVEALPPKHNKPAPTYAPFPKPTPEPYNGYNMDPTMEPYEMHDKNSAPHKMTISDVNNELGELEQEALNTVPPLVIASIILFIICFVGIMCFRCGRLGCISKRRRGGASSSPHEQTVSIMLTDEDKEII